MTDIRPALFKAEAAHYDPNEFYVSSVDDAGNTKQLRASVPPALYSELERLVQSGMIPAYGTKEAFVRDAMVHRLKWLAANIQNLNLEKAVNHQIRQSDMQRRIDEMTSCRRYVETTKQGIRDAQDSNDAIAVDEIAMTGWAAAQDMRAPYNTQLKDLCRNASSFDLTHTSNWPTAIVETMAMEDIKFQRRLEAQAEADMEPNILDLPDAVDINGSNHLRKGRPKVGGKGGAKTSRLFGTSK